MVCGSVSVANAARLISRLRLYPIVKQGTVRRETSNISRKMLFLLFFPRTKIELQAKITSINRRNEKWMEESIFQ